MTNTDVYSALKLAYELIIKANLRDKPEENQRCGRCDYCEALLSNADDDDCGECYSIVTVLAALARLDKAAVEPVPVDAGEWIVEAYPVHDANEAKQFLADTVDATENFSGTMYWVRDSENRAVAITGCGAKGKQNAERIASLPARRGVSEWLPIESAPKDGTLILLGNSATGEVEQGAWLDGPKTDRAGWCSYRGHWRINAEHPNWKWQPLPLPPTPSEAV